MGYYVYGSFKAAVLSFRVYVLGTYVFVFCQKCVSLETIKGFSYRFKDPRPYINSNIFFKTFMQFQALCARHQLHWELQ